MSWLIFALPLVPSVALGYVIGNGRGYDEGYQIGYHEGEFDASVRKARHV